MKNNTHIHCKACPLLPTGRKIIECCLSGGTLMDYENLLNMTTLETA